MTTGRVLLTIAVEGVVLAALLGLLRARGWQRERLGLQFSWKAAAAGIPLFIIYLLLYLVAATLVLLVWPAARDVWTLRSATTAPFWLMLLFFVINAVFIEMTATAYTIAALSRHGAAVAIAASTLFRVALHLHEGPLAALGIVPVGLLFATMFWRWRNVTPLIVAHALANVVVFAVR
jgi:hypothetical protein